MEREEEQQDGTHKVCSRQSANLPMKGFENANAGGGQRGPKRTETTKRPSVTEARRNKALMHLSRNGYRGNAMFTLHTDRLCLSQLLKHLC